MREGLIIEKVEEFNYECSLGSTTEEPARTPQFTVGAVHYRRDGSAVRTTLRVIPRVSEWDYRANTILRSPKTAYRNGSILSPFTPRPESR